MDSGGATVSGEERMLRIVQRVLGEQEREGVRSVSAHIHRRSESGRSDLVVWIVADDDNDDHRNQHGVYLPVETFADYPFLERRIETIVKLIVVHLHEVTRRRKSGEPPTWQEG